MSEKDDDLGMWDEAMDEQAEAESQAETVKLEELQEEEAPITNEEKRKLEVMVKIFGRKTPLELSYMQVEKV